MLFDIDVSVDMDGRVNLTVIEHVREQDLSTTFSYSVVQRRHEGAEVIELQAPCKPLKTTNMGAPKSHASLKCL